MAGLVFREWSIPRNWNELFSLVSLISLNTVPDHAPA
jgi:hypothetical protein